jgi:hypothetical protein
MEKSESIISKLAISLGRRDEKPNQDLAHEIAASKNKKAVREIVDNLHNKDKNIQSDCIKVLDEIGVINASLIHPYTEELVDLLTHKNNRLQWGAMAALDEIAALHSKTIYSYLTRIISSAEKGSVITKDRCFRLLIKLSRQKEYKKEMLPIILEQLLRSAPNQFPMYAEEAADVIDKPHAKRFIDLLTARRQNAEKESQRKRIEKVTKTINRLLQ